MISGLLLLLISIFCIAPADKVSDDPHPILTRYREKLMASPGMSYTLTYRMKFFSKDDTIQSVINGYLWREADDTLYGGQFVLVRDSMWAAYNGHMIYSGDTTGHKLVQADPAIYERLYLENTGWDEMIYKNFLRVPDRAEFELLQHPDLDIRWQDTVLHNIPYVVAGIYFPDDEGFTDMVYSFYFNQNTALLDAKQLVMQFQGNWQYKYWSYSNYRFTDKPELRYLEREFLNGFFNVVDYDADRGQQWREEMTRIDALTGKYMLQDERFDLRNIDAELVLLDFWYMSCFPCIKSIPLVNTLYEKYTDKGVAIYGVNMFDEEEKQRDRMVKFLQNNPMSYRTVLVDKDAKKGILVHGYPSIIILDRTGEILYSKVGYSPELVENMSVVIDSLLAR
jgi:thiol-disulfide isomerase/thioredoxin